MIWRRLRHALGLKSADIYSTLRSSSNPFADRVWTSAERLVLHARDYPPAAGAARLPVLCLPGLTRNAADFEVVAPWIAARGRRVLALDLRGRGASAWDPQPMNYMPLSYAADVLALMDTAGIGRALFVGTSLGGIVTMVLASLRPAAVAGAVLNDVGPSLNPEALRRIGAYTGRDPEVQDWAGAAAYARDVNAAAFPDYGPAQWTAFARRLFTEGPDGRPRLAYDPEIIAPIRAAGPDALAPDITPLFLTLATGRPLLLVRGGISDLLDPPRAEAMRMLAPHMAYAEVPNVGHAPMLDEPEALEALAAFLDGAP
ncbi:MAG TPA: alpha/beta hydrolase [Caulobacteraceae bacterium]|jgi:pimeloyl-ACP methyl ester carboxylesterase|nr:alpha/beta hydrolase [Caulobacteraceae bacterium]